MIPEEKAALIVWRIMVPSMPFEEFERHLVSHRRPEWNQAVGMIADAIQGSRPGRELCLQQTSDEYEAELLAAGAVYCRSCWRRHYEEGDSPRWRKRHREDARPAERS